MLRRPRALAAIAGIALLVAPSAALAGVFNLRPPPPPVPWGPLAGQDLWPQIDQLTDDLDRGDEATRAERHVLLAYSYAALGGAEHRNVALDHMKAAYALDPDRAEILESRAILLHEMGYVHEAVSLLAKITTVHPNRFPAHYANGWFHLKEGLTVLNSDRLLTALAAFQQCTRLVPDNVAAWWARSTCALVVGDLGDAAYSAEQACTLTSSWKEGHLLAGAAHAGLGNAPAAESSFQLGLAKASPAIREAFEARAALTPEVLAHDLRYPVDTAGANLGPSRESYGELAYWRRLVEADLLFGELAGLEPGWETAPGTAWIRWGRPAGTQYEAPEFEDIEWGTQGAASETSEKIGSGRRKAPDTYKVGLGTHGLQRWHWIYPGDENPIVLTFVDATRHRRWTASDQAGIMMAAMEKEQPYALPKSPPPARFSVLASGAGFYGAQGRPRLEVYLQVEGEIRGSQPDVPAVFVNWSVQGESGEVTASGAHELTRNHATEDGVFLGVLNHSFDPGRYRLLLGLTDMAAGGHRTLAMDVALSRAPGALTLSDIELATSFLRKDEAPEQTPAEYVKHDHVVLPHPSATYGTQDPMYVYFEIYNAETNSQMRTHFDVSYEVFARENAPDKKEIVEQLHEIKPLAVTFVSEKTGVSSQGHVVKGSRVDLDALGPGEYVLAVTVADRLGDVRATQSVAFRKVP